jgi:hypothetical protein
MHNTIQDLCKLATTLQLLFAKEKRRKATKKRKKKKRKTKNLQRSQTENGGKVAVCRFGESTLHFYERY